MAFTSTLFSKIKQFSENQKRSIKEKLYSKGEFPLYFQILIAIFFWLFLFVLLLIVWNPEMKWSLVIIAVVGAYLAVEAVNYVGRKIVAFNAVKNEVEEDYELQEQLFPETELLESNSIIVGDMFKSGGIVLSKKNKGKLQLTPVIVQTVSSISSTNSLFSFLSGTSLRKISLKYHCSVVDSSQYEVLLLRGSSIKCRTKSLSSILLKLREKFFYEAIDLISELRLEKRIELETPHFSVLKELFPTYSKIVKLSNKQSDEGAISQISSLEEISLLSNKEENLEVEDEIEEEVAEVKISNKNPQIEIQKSDYSVQQTQQKNMIKEVLFKELDFSFESFLNAAKGYYKKGIENNLGKTFQIKQDKFLKTVYLFCDKQNLSFFYPSYSYLLKIMEFMEIEFPSSSDIENYATKLADEYISIIIPEDIASELDGFLNQKFKNNGSSRLETDAIQNTDVESIPLPPPKKIENNGDETHD